MGASAVGRGLELHGRRREQFKQPKKRVAVQTGYHGPESLVGSPPAQRAVAVPQPFGPKLGRLRGADESNPGRMTANLKVIDAHRYLTLKGWPRYLQDCACVLCSEVVLHVAEAACRFG